MEGQAIGLVGDVGGTHVRLALVDAAGALVEPMTLPAADYATLSDAIAAYLNLARPARRPKRIVLAVAGPVIDGAIRFTNLDWRVSEAELAERFGLEAARLVNDFAAQALAAPRLGDGEVLRLGPALKGDPSAPILVLGAGTGFGVAGLVRSASGETPVESEGGHAGFAPHDAVEEKVLAILRRAHPERVSIERVLSGPGLLALYRALAEIEGAAPLQDTAAGVTAAGLSGEDPVARMAVDRFCAILGGVAGDLALTFGARGGVYVAGGVAPRLVDRLTTGGFRERFEAKGRLSAYAKAIPTALILHPYAALVGAAHLLRTL